MQQHEDSSSSSPATRTTRLRRGQLPTDSVGEPKGKETLSRREIREALQVPDSTVRHWLGELVALEYLALVDPGRQGGGRLRATGSRIARRQASPSIC
jgi:Fic family protein